MVSISLSVEEAEYLRSLLRADIETRETEGPFQDLANSVYDQVMNGRLTIVFEKKSL